MDASGKHLMLLTEVVERMVETRGPLQWEGYFDPVTTELDPETGQGIPFATYTFASHLAMVEVDTETGMVQVKRLVAAQDVGKAINPQRRSGADPGRCRDGSRVRAHGGIPARKDALDERILHPDKPGYP